MRIELIHIKSKSAITVNELLKRCEFYIYLSITTNRLIYWHEIIKLYNFYLKKTC